MRLGNWKKTKRTHVKKLNIKFGERTEVSKINKLEKLNSRSKEYRKITSQSRTVKKSVNIRKVLITIKGGYSKSTYYKERAKGNEVPEYYYKTFASEVNVDYTAGNIRKAIIDAMKEFSEKPVPKKGGGYIENAIPRILEMDVEIVNFKEGIHVQPKSYKSDLKPRRID